eukprot:CAMPEP_0171448570 /NCGR_PEP_ID=MMETSP0881-20121228/39683_1 /TAXON_ID=67004 /ORGANISM="Thalassiosira weissflogii, Strain CCMP1336" /LENGTH=227 /DNA_ID=CAMNT_0011973001 /DNA_START=29 /DNA_END=711 /DNA_ORIENTATION=+
MTIYLARSPFSLVLVTLILCSNRFLLRTQTLNRPSPKRSSSCYMGDHSSATVFEVGDSVTVVEDVMKAGRNLRGLSGEVIETWEKCDVDPTVSSDFSPNFIVVDLVQTCNGELVFSLNRCCCAEWVDDGLSVHVKFNIPHESNEDGRKCCCAEWVDDGLSVHVKFNIPHESNEDGRKVMIAKDVFIHYFAESELVKSEHIGQGQSKIIIDEGGENSAPFVGLSCKTF